MKSIMTIHNLKFQGVWDVKTIQDITGLDKSYFTPDKLEAYGDANYLKGGIVYASEGRYRLRRLDHDGVQNLRGGD